MTYREVNANTSKVIFLGHQGEKIPTRVSFDVTGYTDYTIQLFLQRSADSIPYEVDNFTVDGDTAYWIVSKTDLSYDGKCRAEIHYTLDDQLIKSTVYMAAVTPSLGEPSDTPPDPYEKWFDKMAAESAAAQTAATQAQSAASSFDAAHIKSVTISTDGNSATFTDQSGNQKTFSPATGGGGTGAVSSVNGYTGSVVLNADDVGAASTDDLQKVVDKTPFVATYGTTPYSDVAAAFAAGRAVFALDDFEVYPLSTCADSVFIFSGLSSYTNDEKEATGGQDVVVFSVSEESGWSDTVINPLVYSLNSSGTKIAEINGTPIYETPVEMTEAEGGKSVDLTVGDKTETIPTMSDLSDLSDEVDKKANFDSVYSKTETDTNFATKLSLSEKVGYAEYTDSYLYLYESSAKANQIAKLLIEGGGTSGGISEAKCKEIIESYGYITSDALTVYVKSADLATVATSGSYNDLSDQPTIPDETTVEQVLTSGTEIAKINGTSIYAPEGGGSGSASTMAGNVFVKEDEEPVAVTTSTVSVDQVLTEGAEIGGVTIDGSRVPFFAPSGSDEIWDALIDVTTTDATTSLFQDLTVARKYKKLFFDIYCPKTSTGSTLGIWLNSLFTVNPTFLSFGGSNGCLSTSSIYYSVLFITAVPDGAILESMYNTSYSTDAKIVRNGFYHNTILNTDEISSIGVGSSNRTADILPVGFTLKVYGLRA